jgi:DNA-directed RNA polymerase subunit RPC12/RpoP
MSGNVPDADDDGPEHECPECGSTNTEATAGTRREYKCRVCGTEFHLSDSM